MRFICRFYYAHVDIGLATNLVAHIMMTGYPSDENFTGAALNALQSLWQGPTAVYPNSGYFKMPCWQLDSVIKPTSFAQAVRPQFQKGARVLQALAAEFKIELHG